MKNIKIKLVYSIVLTCLFVATSCKKSFLDESPSTGLPSGEAIQSVQDLSTAVNGVYSAILGDQDNSYRFYYGGDFTLYADVKGSDFVNMDSYNQLSPVGRYQHDQYSDFSEGYYKTMYVALARINDILDRAKALNVSDDEKASYNNDLGQLHALRGLVHFDLARLYAQLPTVASDMNAANSGIPIADKTFGVDYKPTRATLKQTYDFIISELTESLPLLTKSKTTGYINYWAAEALRARVYLYLNENNAALADAADVIKNSPYSLYTLADYTTAWDKEGTSEALFEILTTEQYNSQWNSVGSYTSPAGYAECAATDSFVKFIKSDSADVRSQMVAYEDDNGNEGGYYPLKYPGRAGSMYVNNPKVIRLSEVYLIAAEAAFKGGSANGALSALDYINNLRKNRITDYSPVTSLTIDDILNERRKELFAEGHMVWDFWRNGKSVTNPAVGAVKGSDPLAIVAIPYREIQIAGANNLVQNPGY